MKMFSKIKKRNSGIENGNMEGKVKKGKRTEKFETKRLEDRKEIRVVKKKRNKKYEKGEQNMKKRRWKSIMINSCRLRNFSDFIIGGGGVYL